MCRVFSEWLIPAPCEPYLPIISLHERSLGKKLQVLNIADEEIFYDEVTLDWRRPQTNFRKELCKLFLL